LEWIAMGRARRLWAERNTEETVGLRGASAQDEMYWEK
jgi:hypothetical protein